MLNGKLNRFSRVTLKHVNVPMVALVTAGLLSGVRPAHAIYADVATTGTVLSGIDSSGVFGSAGRDLSGLAYSLDLIFDSPGSFVFANSSDATTSGFALGSVTVRIGGSSFTTAFTDSFGSYLEQTPKEITASNIGDETGGNFLSVTNQFSTATALLPVNLGVSFSHVGTPADLVANGGGPVTFSLAGNSENVSFVATPGSVTYTVPEPASLGLLAAGLGMAGLVRRRQRLRGGMHRQPGPVLTVETRR